jgi:hypothetical protein
MALDNEVHDFFYSARSAAPLAERICFQVVGPRSAGKHCPMAAIMIPI